MHFTLSHLYFRYAFSLLCCIILVSQYRAFICSRKTHPPSVVPDCAPNEDEEKENTYPVSHSISLLNCDLKKANTPEAYVQGSKGHFHHLQGAPRGQCVGHNSGYLVIEGELSLQQLIFHFFHFLSVRDNCFHQTKPNTGCDFQSSAHVAHLLLSVPSYN